VYRPETYSAQYGNYLGVHINAVSKAGGNSFSRSSQRSHTQTMPSTRIAHSISQIQRSTLYGKNQFGAELDGPVILPWLYNGRKKDLLHVRLSGPASNVQDDGALHSPDRCGACGRLFCTSDRSQESHPIGPPLTPHASRPMSLKTAVRQSTFAGAAELPATG